MTGAKWEKAPALLRQAVRFVGLSGIGWLLDFTIYTLLSLKLRDLALVNTLSSIAGASFVFMFSTRLVFRDSHRIPLGWKYCIYICFQLLLVFLISRLLAWIDGIIVSCCGIALIVRFAALISKIIVTPITMTINFFAMRGVIEKL